MPTKVQSHTPDPHPYDKVHDPHLQNKNWVHREALQLALGSILTPKRPHTPSRSTSGSLSPAYPYPSISPSHTPGTGTPVHSHSHPPFGSEYLHPHHAYLQQHSHHTPSKLAQSSSNGGSPQGSSYSSPTMTKSPMLPMLEPDDISMRLPPAISRRGGTPVAHDAYDPPPSPGLGPIDDTDPRLKPLRPTLSPLQPQQSFHRNGSAGPAAAPAAATHGSPNPSHTKTVSLPNSLPTMGENNKQQHQTAGGGPGTPKAKFFEALQGKSAWDALIHGSFS